jgi:sec-independent protein translocase protein TatC
MNDEVRVPGETNPEDDVEMTFFDHLGELRTRLIRAVWGLIPGVALGWIFRQELLEFLLEPFTAAWKVRGLGEPTVHFANPIDPFVAYLKLALVAGALFSAPWIFWQLWGFLSPGLYRREKRLALPFVIASTVCFVGGAFFGYAVVFPMAFETFLGFAGMLPSESIRIEPTIMIGEYLSFATRMLLAFGITFEVPVVVTFLAAAGIVHWRELLRFGRWWVLISALLASLLTPPDVGSQILMIGPLVALYFMSVGIAFLVTFRRDKKAKQQD